MGKIRDKDKEYEKKKKERLLKIKQEPNKWKRFWKYVWFAFTFVWIWAWNELRDWRTLLIYLIVSGIVGSEVWVPVLLGIILNKPTWIAFGSAMEAFWLLPGTPFVAICIVITITIKELFFRRKHGRTKGSTNTECTGTSENGQ